MVCKTLCIFKIGCSAQLVCVFIINKKLINWCDVLLSLGLLQRQDVVLSCHKQTKASSDRAVPTFLLRPGSLFKPLTYKQEQRCRRSGSQLSSILPLELGSGCSQVPIWSHTCLCQHRAGCGAGVEVKALGLHLWQWGCLMPTQWLWN